MKRTRTKTKATYPIGGTSEADRAAEYATYAALTAAPKAQPSFLAAFQNTVRKLG